MCYKEKLKNAVYTPTGNKTEVAMLNFLYAAGQEPHTLISERQKDSEIECVIPFNPYSKSQLTVTRVNKGDDKVRVVLKGAPEVVIDHCSHTLNTGMEDPIKFNDEIKK
jgi:Ca2+-transporting ATPase